MDKNVLPDLPGSDPQSLAWNKRHSFYKDSEGKGLGAKDFWEGNRITTHKLEDFKKCEHFFELKGGWFKCQHCHLGLQQTPSHILTINDGKLLHEGKPLY